MKGRVRRDCRVSGHTASGCGTPTQLILGSSVRPTTSLQEGEWCRARKLKCTACATRHFSGTSRPGGTSYPCSTSGTDRDDLSALLPLQHPPL